MKRLGRRLLTVTAALLGGVGVMFLGETFEMLEIVFWPGTFAENLLNPMPPGAMRKDPDPLWFLFGNFAFWSLVVLAAIIVFGRVARRGRRPVAEAA
jgi:hypothetical protein